MCYHVSIMTSPGILCLVLKSYHFNPLVVCWGQYKMIKLSSSSRQPIREAWTLERLNAELTINLGMATDWSMHSSYTSALNLYITFCHLHGFNIEPTPWTLALYVTFQSTAQQNTLVSHALWGAKRCFGVATLWKLPLTRNNLLEVFSSLRRSPSHDDLLFATQLFVGTDCLMWLAELTWPDKVSFHDYHKVMIRHSM